MCTAAIEKMLEELDITFCKFCNNIIDIREEPHLHQGTWVCKDCWDERLRATA